MLHVLFESFASMLAWSLLYGGVRAALRKPPEFANRVVTLCHGVVVAITGSAQCFIDGWPYRTCHAPTTRAQAAILLASLGYFLFDLVWCLYYQTETRLMIAHHVYSCFALLRMLFKSVAANQATCALGLMECTNPLLQARWFIRALGYQRTRLFRCVEVVFVVIFISMRLVLGTLITWEVLAGGEDFEFKLLAVLIYAVSWGFMINMFLYMRKKYNDANKCEPHEAIQGAG